VGPPFVAVGSHDVVGGWVARFRRKTSDPLQVVWRRAPGVRLDLSLDELEDTGHPLGRGARGGGLDTAVTFVLAMVVEVCVSVVPAHT
jgi:hypothetical protein